MEAVLLQAEEMDVFVLNRNASVGSSLDSHPDMSREFSLRLTPLGTLHHASYIFILVTFLRNEPMVRRLLLTVLKL